MHPKWCFLWVIEWREGKRGIDGEWRVNIFFCACDSFCCVSLERWGKRKEGKKLNVSSTSNHHPLKIEVANRTALMPNSLKLDFCYILNFISSTSIQQLVFLSLTCGCSKACKCFYEWQLHLHPQRTKARGFAATGFCKSHQDPNIKYLIINGDWCHKSTRNCLKREDLLHKEVEGLWCHLPRIS